MNEKNSCPCCSSRQVQVFYTARNVPVNSVLLLDSREEALSFPTGDIELAFCSDCGFIYNAAFDPKRLEYSARYEETQGFSPTFRAWHRKLADDLIDRYKLHNKRIVEIGCGKGEFLSMLCELGPNEGVGFDPAYRPERNTSPAKERIEFVRDFYSEAYAGHGGDFVCCKMTLEHIQQTHPFVHMVARSLADRADTTVFFQVPDAQRILQDLAFWDVYYEHCSYFSAGSLARLFRRSGFSPLEVARTYGDQYVMIEAKPRNQASAPLPLEDDLAELARGVEHFAVEVPRLMDTWTQRMRRYAASKQRVVLWGSGSKGVAFLTMLGAETPVEYVVDINPHRHSHFMAGTGQKIVSPAFLEQHRPDVVVVMNSVYRDEIVTELTQRNLHPEVLAL